jgi:Trk-type K+ transport system membrane component
MLDADKFGFVLWEGITLLIVIFGGIGFLVLFRKFRGNPAFTTQDHELFFGRSTTKMPKLRTVLTFGLAVILCGVVGALEFRLLAPLGPGLLTPVQVLSYLAIVHKLFF